MKVKVIVVSHGSFSKGVVNSVQMLAGEQEDFVAYGLYPEQTVTDLTQQLEEELKQLQQEIVNQKHHQSHCDNLLHEYELKKKSFDENPILYNYFILKQEVNDLLCRIQDDINEQLKKKVD